MPVGSESIYSGHLHLEIRMTLYVNVNRSRRQGRVHGSPRPSKHGTNSNQTVSCGLSSWNLGREKGKWVKCDDSAIFVFWVLISFFFTGGRHLISGSMHNAEKLFLTILFLF
jgi:hypothetical protein